MSTPYRRNAKTPAGRIAATPSTATWGGFFGLLQEYAGAAAGYSLRKIGSGPVVRLRRASDNEERDFSAGELTGSSEGSEELTNGDFSNGSTGWNLSGWSIVGGQAVANAGGGLELLDQHALDDQQVGDYIKVTFDLVACSDFANCGMQINSTSLSRFNTILQINSTGTFSFLYYYDTKVNNRFRFYANNSASMTIDNVSVVPYTPTAAESWVIDGRAGFQRQTNESAFATTWYDQSGSGNNATQATAASQPLLIRAGVTELENGKPAMVFDGTDDELTTSSLIPASNDMSSFTVNNFNGQVATTAILGSDEATADRIRATVVAGRMQLSVNGVNANFEGMGAFDSQQVYAVIKSGTAANAWESGSASTSNPAVSDSGAVDFNTIGWTTGLADHYGGTVQEILVYPSDQSANRIGIEGNINDHYGIY